MSFESMLNHRCDVYHIRHANELPGYGLPSSPTFDYPDTPDIEDLKCHFGVHGSRTVIQLEPQANYQANIKLVVPADADIRLNDKIVEKPSGYEYTADIPVKIRAHHKFVMLTRRTVREAL